MSSFMNIGLPVSGPDAGIAQGQTLVRPMIVTPAVTKGDVLSVDRTIVSGDFKAYTTMRNNAAGDNIYGWSAVALETKAAGGICRFGFIGDFAAKSDTAHASLDEPMSLDVASNNLMDSPASSCKIIGFPLEVFSANDVKMVRFNGITGWGVGLLAT